MSLTNYYTLGITSAQQNTEKQTDNHPIINSSNNVSAVAASSTITNSDTTTKLASTHTTSTPTNSVSQTETVPIITSITVTPSVSQTQTVPLITSVSLTTTNQIHPVDSTTTVPMTPVIVTTVVPKENVVVSSSLTACIPSETTYSSKSGTLDVLFPVYLNSSYTQLDNETETDTETEDSDWICVIS